MEEEPSGLVLEWTKKQTKKHLKSEKHTKLRVIKRKSETPNWLRFNSVEMSDVLGM